MTLDQLERDENAVVRRYRYDDESVVVVDFGPRAETAVDVLEDTVIVVIDGEQYEFELPDGDDPHTFIKNGVLTIETEASL